MPDIRPKRSPFVTLSPFVVGSHVVSSETATAFRLPKQFNAYNMQNTMQTAGQTAEWKPEYEGATLVIIRDCHANHNIYNPNTTEEDFDWMTRHAIHQGWLFTIRRSTIKAMAERSVA